MAADLIIDIVRRTGVMEAQPAGFLVGEVSSIFGFPLPTCSVSPPADPGACMKVALSRQEA